MTALPTRLLRPLLWLTLSLLLACTAQPDEVDQVQTQLVDKAMFEGQWWYATTIIDVDYDDAYLATLRGGLGPFEGSMSTDLGVDYNRLGGDALYSAGSFPIARIEFVIDEDTLYAYRTYELTAGGNAGAQAPGFRGQPVAAFAIEGHVDVRNDYDVVTGEERNVRVENTTDRLWHERSHMRVDWSKNLISEFAPHSLAEDDLFTTYERSPVSFTVQEGGGDYPDSYRPSFVSLGEDGDYRFAAEWSEDAGDPVHYMSFVNRELWTPGANCGVCSAIDVTTRSSFLRVPDGHEYAAGKTNHRAFDRFGFFRAMQPTYVRGGEDREVLARHCMVDADCGSGGACDTDARVCVGGLTSDLGETDQLTFYTSRHNLYGDALTDEACAADWQCDGRHGVCGMDAEPCEGQDAERDGSRCDPVARRCTIPARRRPSRAVGYHLTPRFPAHLVRSAFRVVADWNEALMRGRRAERGELAIDEALCGSDGDQVCRTDLARDARTPCQRDDPTGVCFCGSPEDEGGTCAVGYDPFEHPDDAADRGVPRPYDCFVEGPPDVQAPQAYDAYDADDYAYRFVGEECLLTLTANSCDLDAEAPCEALGDLRYQFLGLVSHGAVPFAGIASPLTDPESGELIVSNAYVASETLESMAEIARDYFAVLRGDRDEDDLYSGENLRGYFSRLGRVTAPVESVSLVGDGTTAGTVPRPDAVPLQQLSADTPSAALPVAAERIDALLSRASQLRGAEGRAALFTDRLAVLDDSSVGSRLNALSADEQRAYLGQSPDPATGDRRSTRAPSSIADGGPLRDVLRERQRVAALAARNVDVMEPTLYHSQYWQYWADAFADRPSAEASLRLQQAWFRAVMWHEVGHALGLRHNFAASLDRNQYHPAYFGFARDQPLPFPERYDAPEVGGNGDGTLDGDEVQRWRSDFADAREQRLEAGAGNYMSSSVMDYHGDKSDFSGLGHYDRAAVLFGYFEHTEVYEAPTPLDDPMTAADESSGVSFASQVGQHYSDSIPRQLWRHYAGGESCSEDAHCPHAAGSETTAFQPVRQRCVRNPRDNVGLTAACAGAGDCVCSNFDDDIATYASEDGNDFSPVPYLYCQDGRINDLSWCTPFDAGESFLESIEHYRKRWRESYPQRYFRNYDAYGPRRGFAGFDIPDVAKIYQHFVYRLYYEPGFGQSSYGSTQYLDQLFASVTALDWLVELVAMPDVGSYALDPGAAVYRQLSPDPDASGAEAALSPGLGHYMWSEYQEGLNGFFRLERAGTFVDKVLAMQAITERDWSLNYGLDERLYVNFYDLFPDEVVDVFGGMLLREPRQYAPRLSFGQDGEPQLAYPSALPSLFGSPLTNDALYPEPAVDGIDSEALRTYATTFALATFPVYYDTTFEQRLLIFKLGSGEGYTIPATRNDGSTTCGFGEVGCDTPDYIVYESRRLHTSYVAVRIGGETARDDNQQLSYRLLGGLRLAQERLVELEALPDPTAAEQDEMAALVRRIERDEGFAEYLIELSRQFGISSPFR